MSARARRWVACAWAAIGVGLTVVTPAQTVVHAADAPTGVVGNSCVIALSNDALNYTTTLSSSVTFRLKCAWSGAGGGTPTTDYTSEFKPFYSDTPTQIGMYNATGGAGTSPVVRHGTGTRSRICNVTAFTRVDGGAVPGRGEWSWRCSSITGSGGGNLVVDELVLAWSTGGAMLSFGGGVRICGLGRDTYTWGSPVVTDAYSCERTTAALFDTTEPAYDWAYLAATACSTIDVDGNGAEWDTLVTSSNPLNLDISWDAEDPPVALFFYHPGIERLAGKNILDDLEYGDDYVMFEGFDKPNLHPPGDADPTEFSYAAVIKQLAKIGGGSTPTADPFIASQVLIGCAWSTPLGVTVEVRAFGDDFGDTPYRRECMDLKVAWSGTLSSGSVKGWISISPLEPGFPIELSWRLAPAGEEPTDWSSWVEYDLVNDALNEIVIGPVGGAIGDVELRCQDSEGIMDDAFGSDGTWGSIPLPDTIGEDQGDGNCISRSGIGLSPSSWLPAGARIGVCLTKWAVIPSASQWAIIRASGESISDHVPFSYVIDVGGLLKDTFAGAPDAVTAHQSDCLNLIEDESEIGMGDVGICPSTVSSSGIVTLRSILVVVFWFGFGWGVWHQTRQVLSR